MVRAWTPLSASRHLHIPDETSDSNHSSVVTARFSFLQTNLYTTGRGTEASRAREGKASFVARRRRHPGVESAIHALWKVMAWTGCARRAGKASNAPWVSRSSQPTCTGSDACCSNGRSGGTIARTTLSFGGLAVPILNIHPSRPSGRTPHAPKASRRTSFALLEPRPMGGDDPSYIS